MAEAVPAPLAPDEPARLSALFATGLLDSEPEALFDNITGLASTILGTPISLVSLVDADRQWFKSAVGLAVRQTPREQAFCAHAILRPDQPFIVEDTFTDQRFATNPLVTGAPHIRFYAGIPLVTQDGHALGTLCVIDQEPRQLSPEQLHSLRSLGTLAAHLIDVRLHERQSQAARIEPVRKPARLKALDAFEAMFAQGVVGAVVSDADGVVTRTNDAFARLVGVPVKQLVSRQLHEFTDPADRGLFDELHATMKRDGVEAHMQFQTRLVNTSSAVVHVSMSSSCVIDDRTNTPLVVTLVHDVTDHVVVNNELTYRATHDALTGLANRNLFNQHLQQSLDRLGIEAGQLALMFLDLDEFKLINDHYGHRVGDAVLQEVAARVASALGPRDVVARFGGDEFTVLCHVADQQHALVVAATLAKALEAPILVEGGLVNASMSIGIGVTSAPGTKPGELLRQADVAMYQAKAHGNGGVALFTTPRMSGATVTPAEFNLVHTRLRR